MAWSGSFSLDADAVARWYAVREDPGWAARRAQVSAVLAEADRLADLAALVGRSSLPSRERVVLWGGRLIREGFLQQSALSANDAHCSPEKTRALLEAVLDVIDACHTAVERGVTATEIEELDVEF